MPADEEPYSDPVEPEPADELDGVRIRQLAALRRGAYRARSHAIIGSVLLFVLAVSLVIMALGHVRTRGWDFVPLVYLAVTMVSTLGCLYFSRRAIALHCEATAPIPQPPIPPGGPDFSTLSDGSQQWKNLEDVF